MANLDRFVFYGLIALLVWVPIPFASNRTWAVGILVALSQVLLFSWLVSAYLAKEDIFPRMKRFAWPLGLVFVFLCLQWFQTIPLPGEWVAALSPKAFEVQEGVTEQFYLSIDPVASELRVLLTYAYLSTLLVAVMVVRDKKRLDTLAYALVFSGLFQSFVAVALFAMRAKYDLFFIHMEHNRALGTFVYHNNLAGYLEMCLSIGVGLMLARLGSGSGRFWRGNWQRRLKIALEFMLSRKMLLRGLLIIIFIALVLTKSRMGNAGFFTSLLIVGAIGIYYSRKMAPTTVSLIASLVIVDLLIVGSLVGLDKVSTRIEETALTEEVRLEKQMKSESVEQRTEPARYAMDLLKDFPLFGSGGGSFYHAFIPYRVPNHLYWDHAHNDFVEFATDYGLIGFSMVALLVVLTTVKAVQVLRNRRSSVPRGIAFGGLMALVAIMIHSGVDFNLQIPANSLTFVVVLAMIWCAAELPSGRERTA